MGQWDEFLDQYLTQPGHGYQQALQNIGDCQFYQQSPSQNDQGWQKVYQEECERSLTQEDGTTKMVKINEAQTIKDIINRHQKQDGVSSTGIWIGGVKHTCTLEDDEFTQGDNKFKVRSVMSPGKKGQHIVCTEKSVVVIMYNEQENQPSGNQLTQQVEFQIYMQGQGL